MFYRVLLLIVLIVSAQTYAQASPVGYQACINFLQTLGFGSSKTGTGYGPQHAANLCSVLQAGGVCTAGTSGNTASVDGTNQLGTPARCLGVLYGLSAMGRMNFQVPNMGCGDTANGAHVQCENMMTQLCSGGPYLGAQKGSLCWWMMGLGTNQRIDLYGTVGQSTSLATAINNVCYTNAGPNPLVYSSMTGCMPQDVSTEGN